MFSPGNRTKFLCMRVMVISVWASEDEWKSESEGEGESESEGGGKNKGKGE